MKNFVAFKIVLMLNLVLFVLTGCETEPVNSLNETTTGISAKAKKNKQGSDDENEEDGCETAFARGSDSQSECFLDFEDLKSNRWGWSIGPISEGNYSFDIYSGAGQCDLSKGTIAGQLEVNYSDGNLSVKYEMNSGFVMTETHLYAGNDPLPEKNGKPTVAPGQYPYGRNYDGASYDTFEVNDLSGEIYLVAHAVVCDGDTVEPCIPEPITYCGGVRYNFWGLGTFWGGNYNNSDYVLNYTNEEDGSIHISGQTKMNSSTGCIATVDVWLINPRNYQMWSDNGGMAHLPDDACATMYPEEWVYYLVDETRSTIQVGNCAEGADLGGTYQVFHAPEDLSKGFQIGRGASLFQEGDAPGLSGWMLLQKEGTDEKLPSDFNFLICQ